jgi:hypothetical protein
MIHIIDNFFNDHLDEAKDWSSSLNKYDTWYDKYSLDLGLNLVAKAGEFFDLTGFSGCEMHINYHTPTRHYDKDEVLFAGTGKLVFPLCGIVWYKHIDMIGGEIVFPEVGVSIMPKTDRLIIFKGDLLHQGNPFQGVRLSVGINPWLEKPLAYAVLV